MGQPPLRVISKHHLKLIPWSVSREHHTHTLLQALQSEARSRDKQEVAQSSEYRRRKVAEMIGDGNVIHYDRSTDEGFVLVPARPGIDEDWIREPWITDDGQRISKDEARALHLREV